jgi:hypothetical protein
VGNRTYVVTESATATNRFVCAIHEATEGRKTKPVTCSAATNERAHSSILRETVLNIAGNVKQKPDRQCTCNVTLRRDSAAVVAVGKAMSNNKMCVCL